MVIAINEDRCITRDTSYVNIKVGSNRAFIKGRLEEELPCGSRRYKFINESEITPGIPSFSSKSFVWDYGHDGQRDTVGVGNASHTFPAPGSYIVRLYLIDDNYCNQSDYLEFRVYVSAFVKADFETPPTGCIPYTAEFINKSIGGNEFKWFIDGNLFHYGIEPPPYSFGSVIRDDYDVMLVVNDIGVCPRTDTSHFNVSVKPNPIAEFSYSPVPPKENTPVVFTNLSFGAETYLWNFGDDYTSKAKDTSHIFQETGTFNVCLTAYSKFGCQSIYCDNVEALIYPLANLPNAFTPNGDGINDILYVKAYGVKNFAFRIYNRLGQVVFASSNLYSGWDGKFKGILQPMDAYAYTLSVLFWNGEQMNKKGDITLIR
jgi:gliding motility-associated-like protein